MSDNVNICIALGFLFSKVTHMFGVLIISILVSSRPVDTGMLG